MESAGQLWSTEYMGALARRPVIAHAQFGPGDGHPLPAGRTHLRREVDDAAVVLHVLKLVLLGWFHIDHGVLVNVFLQNHRLWRKSKTTILQFYF